MQEQTILAKELEDYIQHFQELTQFGKYELKEREKIVLFVMNLHPRWKRLVEHYEPLATCVNDIIFMVRYHSAKYSVLLGAPAHYDMPIFDSSSAKQALASGDFAWARCPSPVPSSPDNGPETATKDTRPAPIKVVRNDPLASSPSIPSPQQQASPTPQTATPATPTVPSMPATPVSSTPAVPATKETTAPVKKEADEKAASPALSPTATTPQPPDASPPGPSTPRSKPAAATKSSSSTTTSTSTSTAQTCNDCQSKAGKKSKSKKKKRKNQYAEWPFFADHPELFHELAMRFEHFIHKDAQDEDSVCSYLPKAHENVNLPFLNLSIHDHTIEALLAKQRWQSSVISITGLRCIGLSVFDIDDEDKERVVTEFGVVEQSMGSVMLPVRYEPECPGACYTAVRFQVLPMIYGNRVAMILGADFFAGTNAKFYPSRRKVQINDHEVQFNTKTLNMDSPLLPAPFYR
ncbi:hypothetical protein DM01DRAFT_1333567 [Hesseltinella vesiculosa]|uniref:Uncharacterized protein n=1 Tax=Hesseltinella vesiculosa TaxID=101127 RepID=A0A1X2GQE4_9FUNG|nr:hypothetical protein DM01DRAFT_1333567 [Hesseltinella vesiculosa]